LRLPEQSDGVDRVAAAAHGGQAPVQTLVQGTGEVLGVQSAEVGEVFGVRCGSGEEETFLLEVLLGRR
jgi:hypothetical protein